MDKKLFKRLVESMQQMDEIVRGARAPSREFFVDAAKVKEIRAMTGVLRKNTQQQSLIPQSLHAVRRIGE